MRTVNDLEQQLVSFRIPKWNDDYLGLKLCIKMFNLKFEFIWSCFNLIFNSKVKLN